jgi:hypothetical protein
MRTVVSMVGQRTNGILAAVYAQCSAECPVDCFFHRVIEEIGQGRNDCETELEYSSAHRPDPKRKRKNKKKRRKKKKREKDIPR